MHPLRYTFLSLINKKKKTQNQKINKKIHKIQENKFLSSRYIPIFQPLLFSSFPLNLAYIVPFFLFLICQQHTTKNNTDK